MSLELVTVWDGSRTGPNRGLLCVPADVPREAPQPPPMVPGQVVVRPEGYGTLRKAILVLLDDGAIWRVRDVVRLLSRDPHGVHSSIHQLRIHGRIVSRGRGKIQRVRSAA